MEFFEAINNLYLKKTKYTLKEVASHVWSIQKYMSMDENLLLPIGMFNRYFYVLRERYYVLLDRFIPKMYGKPLFKYVKRNKAELDEEACRRIAKMYGVSSREAYQYLELMKAQMDDVYSLLGIEAKEKKNA